MSERKTLSDLLVAAENAKKEANAAILSDSASKIAKTKEALDTAIKEYNEMAITLDFQTLRANSNPMLAAIEQLDIATIEAKANKDKETGIITYAIEPASKQISLVAFDEFCQREKLTIAPDRLWYHKVEKFCLLITYKVMKDLGKDTKKLEETYYIADAAKQIDMGKTPTSNTAILKQLQTIIDGIIFEDDGGKNAYKAISHDAAYIVATMTRRGRESGTVVTPRTNTMHMLVMDVLHRIATDGEYKVEYTTKKQIAKAKEKADKNEIVCTDSGDSWDVNGVSYSKDVFKTSADAIEDFKKDMAR